MRIYSVYVRRHGLDPERDIAMVKEGFSWPAFAFAALWALWHRHWLWAAGLFLIPLGLGASAGAIGLNPAGQATLTIGWSAVIGLFANDLRRWILERDGFVEAGVAAGKNDDGALLSFFSDDRGRIEGSLQ